jgi:hypothetical protein
MLAEDAAKKRKRDDPSKVERKKMFGDSTIEWFDGAYEFLANIFPVEVFLRGDKDAYPSVEVRSAT